MTLTGVKSRPLLRGTLAQMTQWQALLARANLRIYPYQLGCMVRANSSGTTVSTYGEGEFAANNYLMACAATAYGQGTLFIPDLARISRVSAVSGADDELTISPALSLVAGEYLLNLGNDGAATPLITPNYDGSTISLYDDNAGVSAHATDYLLTASNGEFRGWTGSGTELVDLLVTDTSNGLIIAIPMVPTGPEVL